MTAAAQWVIHRRIPPECCAFLCWLTAMRDSLASPIRPSSGLITMNGTIRIRLEAYDHQVLDASAREIVDQAKISGARVAGPVPLPTRREIYTVNRSPFIDKKSREQFEIRTHKRIIDITDPNSKTVDALNRLVVPAGVFVKIKT